MRATQITFCAWTLLGGACAASKLAEPVGPLTGAPAARLVPEEAAYLSDLRQLTFGGENAEAYWAFDGRALSFQAHRDGEGCDRIYRMPFDPAGPALPPTQISSGKGATTCAHYFPTGDLLYASTHLAGDACPPRPDMSLGYVWALYDSYDIFKVKADGSGTRRLTTSKGYDAEATVCAKDGSIVFTSTRDGDIELYRMDADGGNVKRLTSTVGYDGGAFFNADCSKLVWRASRPLPGKQQDEFRSLLARGLVRPSKLELWIANADGTEAMQLTYLDSASFAPFFHPDGTFIIFSSNHPNPRGREFDLWTIRTNGTDLRRITHAPGFDGFPHFSPDGRWLAFSSNRATAPGRSDTNLFVARWQGLGRGVAVADTPAARIVRTVEKLADPAWQGRGVETDGLAQAGAYLEAELRKIGVEPAGDEGGFRQKFPITIGVDVDPTSFVELDGQRVPSGSFSALGFSGSGTARAPLVLAGYGIVDESLHVDDYAGVDVKGKIVLVRRFAPEGGKFADAGQRRRLGDLRRKAFLARERGAKALLVVDWPLPPDPAPADWKPPGEAALLAASAESAGDAGIPVVMLRRSSVEPVMALLTLAGKTAAKAKAVAAGLNIKLAFKKSDAFNVIGRIAAGKPSPASAGPLIIGAHYDHLGLGGRASLAPDKHQPHLGADDNASGTATVLEITRALAARRADLPRDILVMFFSGEETGLLGSTHFVRAREAQTKSAVAMLNLDMVGRLRDNRVQVLGTDSAAEWAVLVAAACDGEHIGCATKGDGFGPSDQAAFYGAGVPVLHFFTGSHSDYHKPSDTADKINGAGAAAVARLVERIALTAGARPALTYRKGTTSPMGAGDARSFSASLGTIPDYVGPAGGKPGVLLSGVRAGGAAEQAGMKRGDVLVRLGRNDIRSVEDLGYALNGAKPGETVTAVIIRDGKEMKLTTTFQESKR